MNLLYLCDEYPPVQTGGIGTVTRIVAEAMSRHGHNVYVVSGRPEGHGLPPQTVINGVTVYRLTYFSELRWLRFFSGKFRKYALILLTATGVMHKAAKNAMRTNFRFVENLIQEKRIDLIEIPDYSILSKYFIRRIRFPKYEIPTVARVHGARSFLSYYRRGRISATERANDLALYASADRICAVSCFSRRFCNDILGVPQPVDVIYNPLDNDFMKLSPQTRPTRNIVFLGKIVEAKGVFSLIEAFNRIAQKFPDVRLVMIGRGETEKALSTVAEPFRDRVEFTGYKSRNEIKRLVSESLFTVIPTYFENFSMAALEVMACRKALIYTKRASGPELIDDGVNGILVEPTDAGQIASAMTRLLENPVLCRTMGEKAFETIRTRFTEDVIANRLETYYKETVSACGFQTGRKKSTND